MTEDASAVMSTLGIRRGLSLHQLARELRWSRPGADAPTKAFDTHRVWRAVSSLRMAGFIEERVSVAGSRWKVVR